VIIFAGEIFHFILFKNLKIKDMKHVRFSLLFLMGVFCMFLFHSCNTCSRPKTIENITIDLDMADLAMESIYLNMGQKVLYALPVPIEASMLVKNWGVPYPELLNDPANASSYLTKKKQAVNLGIYITDMTTAGIYEQTQTVLSYRQAVLQLIEGLGLQSAVDSEVVQQLEDNINNKNELLQIISDLYATCTEFLSEEDRDFYALAMLSGGWVEGMFIATSMIDENEVANEEKMKQIVTDNKLTFDLLWQALSEMDVIPEEALYLMLDMSYIAHLFGHQTLISASVPPRDPNCNVDNVTPKYFAELKSYIHQLRQQFVKK